MGEPGKREKGRHGRQAKPRRVLQHTKRFGGERKKANVHRSARRLWLGGRKERKTAGQSPLITKTTLHFGSQKNNEHGPSAEQKTKKKKKGWRQGEGGRLYAIGKYSKKKNVW